MRALLFTLLFSFTISLASIHAQSGNIENHLHPPVDIPMLLSGNFGELRSNHFHSGIDIKTQGTTGKKVYAIADGYVSRIRVSANGYGRALYIHHPEKGLTSVYGHLKRFNKKVAGFVENSQYEQQNFEVQLFPEKQLFPVKKGDLVGLSGNSGSSEGPHLHFEIRQLADQKPLNPLHYQLDVVDNIPPKVFNLAIYPVGKGSAVDGRRQKQFYEVVTRSQGNYGLMDQAIPQVTGPIGFGIRAYDFLDGSPNWCGLYTVKLYVDNTLVYHHQMDGFSFYETRYINSFIDYEEKIKNSRTYQKSWLQPNNPLSIYEYLRNDGIHTFTDDTLHEITYKITDVYGNTSALSFRVQSRVDPPDSLKLEQKADGVVMPYNQANSFENSHIKLNFPKKAFYDTLRFKYSRSEAPINQGIFYSGLHHIHNEHTPVHKGYTLSIKPEGLPEMLQNKAFIALVNGEDEPYVYQGGEFINGHISTQVRKFGKYAVLVDRQEPSIKPLVINDQKISFQISDELSGIKSYNGYINGQWVLFEYDPKNERITYQIDQERIKQADSYELELYVSDPLNNIATYHDTLTMNRGLKEKR
jgi:hypothetical protein